MFKPMKVSAHPDRDFLAGVYLTRVEKGYVTIIAPCERCHGNVHEHTEREKSLSVEETSEPLDNPILYGGQRSDAYHFFATPDSIRAGCRHFTSFTDAREHWKFTREGTPLGDETFAILDKLEELTKAAGWKL